VYKSAALPKLQKNAFEIIYLLIFNCLSTDLAKRKKPGDRSPGFFFIAAFC